jgi:hypothetical protein
MPARYGECTHLWDRYYLSTVVASQELKTHTAMHSRQSSHPVVLIGEDESSKA